MLKFHGKLSSHPNCCLNRSADIIHFVFLDISESLDWSAMSRSYFVVNYLKLYSLCDCAFSFISLIKHLLHSLP